MTPRKSASVLLLIFALGLYAWFPVWVAFHSLNNNDFKHIYLGMKALMDGISPYSFNALHHQAALQGYRQISLNPYVYLPFTGQAMAFLAPFRLEQAVVVWFMLNHIFAGACIWMLSGLWPRRRLLAIALLTLAMAVSFPLFRTLTAGQLNVALLLLICVARQQLIRGRPFVAGFVLAIAALFKLMPGIYGLYLILRRRWSAGAAMLGSGVLLLIASTFAAGVHTSLQFVPILRQMSYGKSTWPEVFSFWDDPPNQSLNSFFSHIFVGGDAATSWLALGQSAANAATWLSVLIFIAAYVLILLRTAPAAASERPSPVDLTVSDDHAYSATLLLGLLVPSLMWDHYLVMTLLPVCVLLKSATRLRMWKTAGLVVVCYLIICIPWPFDHPQFRQGPGIILMSVKLWPTIFLFGLSLCFLNMKTAAPVMPLAARAISSSNPQQSESRPYA